MNGDQAEKGGDDMRKLIFALATVGAFAVPMLQSSAADAGYACRIGGRWYSGRCPERVAALGIDGRAHWYRNRYYCLRTMHWGHC